MRRRDRDPAQRLRLAVESLPRRTREAMLLGIDSNEIVVGAYVDRASGGICPMLAAHRNGGRTSLASFARAWDRYTDARRPRLATRRELRTLRALLTASLAGELDPASGSIAEAAARIRTERAELAARRAQAPADADPGSEAHVVETGERHRSAELRTRRRWAWMRPARGYDHFKDLVAAAEEQLSEQSADEVLGAPKHRDPSAEPARS